MCIRDSMPACLLACQLACLCACVPACLRACVPSCLRACVRAFSAVHHRVGCAVEPVQRRGCGLGHGLTDNGCLCVWSAWLYTWQVRRGGPA
eukprot:14198622-Alexandrium_andersonii.AAC.1